MAKPSKLREGFFFAGPTRLPDGLSAIGTTSCVTDELLNEDSTLHFLDKSLEMESFGLCREFPDPDDSPRPFAFCGSGPSFVVSLASEDEVVR